jgi:hypothetical protein
MFFSNMKKVFIMHKIILHPKIYFWGIFIIFAATIGIKAKVAQIKLQELVKSSDLIVIATIESVELEDKDGERMAKGIILEKWKGNAKKDLLFSIRQQWVCDGSNSVIGEHVVLFLTAEKSNGKSLYRITHSGNGRMPMNEESAKWYLKISPAIDLADSFPEWDPHYKGIIKLEDFRAAVIKIIAAQK